MAYQESSLNEQSSLTKECIVQDLDVIRKHQEKLNFRMLFLLLRKDMGDSPVQLNNFDSHFITFI